VGLLRQAHPFFEVLMDLRCSCTVLWGLKVMVEGTEYQIASDGLCLGVSENHAAVLMQNSAWLAEPQKQKPVAKPAMKQDSKNAAKVAREKE